jgi:iron complex outermembrane receptor protein
VKTFYIAAAWICGFATRLPAVEPPESSGNFMQDMIVTAPKVKSLTSQTATESREELLKVPGGTEVVEADRYLTGRASTLADTFALSPGVVAQSRFGSDEARLSIRGSGLQRTFHGRGIMVMQDGIPINLADGSFDMQSIEPLAASHINVWRGANALDKGSSTLGGAIDYISRTGLNSPGGVARLEVGSYGYIRGVVAGGYSQGSSDLYGAFTAQSQSGFRHHAQQDNQRVFTNVGWRINDDVETRFYLTGVHTESELPGNLFKSQLNTNPRMAAPGNLTSDQRRDFDLFRIANKTTLRDRTTTWEFIAAWTHKDLDHPIFQVIDQNSNDLILGIAGTHEGTLLGLPNRFRGGLNFSLGMIDSANYANVFGKRGALVASAEQTATNVEAFLEDQLTLGSRLTLVAGASAAYNRRESDTIVGATRDYDNDYTRFSPKLGFRWDAGDQIQVYGNVSGSYEPPSFSEAIVNTLTNKAQTATSIELGTRGERGPVRWDAAFYHAQIRNELLSIDHDNLPTPSITVNADRTTHTGIEVGLEADLLGRSWEESAIDRLVFRSAWTYGDFRFDDDLRYGNNKIAGLPPHLIRGELLWTSAAGWYAGPTLEWVPVKAFIDHRNTFAADPYALLGFKFGQRRDEGLSWFVEARNLTDESFASTTGVIENAGGVDQAQFLPGDGRSVFGGIEWRW